MSKMCGASGGKGNKGMFIERDPKICAAGAPSKQPEATVANCLQHYLLQEEANALIGDSIKPAKKQVIIPSRRLNTRDTRNAGPFNEVAGLINPPVKTKFQSLVDDFKKTAYNSYWEKNVGQIPDPTPTLPAGFDVLASLGKRLSSRERLYDIVMPKEPLSDKMPKSELPGSQTDRNYLTPSYNPDTIFGKKANVDHRGKYVRCCLTYDDMLQGTSLKKPLNTTLVNFQEEKRPQMGVAMSPNNNINCVPDGFSFGKIIRNSDNIMECLVTCELNPNREFFKKCLAHLNSLRKFLAKRYEKAFFRSLYFSLRYYDYKKTGWLPKETVYKYCNDKLIRINRALLEPLLYMWDVFDGASIEYKTFVSIINFSEVIPELTKVRDIPEDCIDFKTTYKEMVKLHQDVDTKKRAGVPSGRYFDMDYPVTPKGCCKADRSYLPDESDAMVCLCPSLFTLLGISHRDLYAKREPDTIRRVFEAIGDRFIDENFNSIWVNAQKYHSQGWVSYETFRHSVNKLKSLEKKI